MLRGILEAVLADASACLPSVSTVRAALWPPLSISSSSVVAMRAMFLLASHPASRLDAHAKEMNTARRVPQRTNTILIVYINPICKRGMATTFVAEEKRKPNE